MKAKVKKRTWRGADGIEKEAWIVRYTDQHGKRHIKTFALKRKADDFALTVMVEVSEGTHTPDNKSVTVAEAAELWIKTGENSGLERATLAVYKQHVDYHIAPFVGRLRLSQLNTATIRQFEDALRSGVPVPGQNEKIALKRSSGMARRVLTSLGSILIDAQERGLVARNVVAELRKHRRGKGRSVERRQKGKLQVGVDIPTPGEIRAIIAKLHGRWRAFLLTAIFSGLRASELRGLRWSDVDLDKGELQIRQRADRYNVIGPPKSESGERTVPLPPMVVNTLREWKLACPRGPLGLAFPSGRGNVESHGNIINRAWLPFQIAAGVTADAKDETGALMRDKDGIPIKQAKYSGLHALRHFYASWCINRKVDGGLELPAKLVQQRLGHSMIAMTMDVYGHLFERGDDGLELAAAERLLIV